jgi:hypothetical protein
LLKAVNDDGEIVGLFEPRQNRYRNSRPNQGDYMTTKTAAEIADDLMAHAQRCAHEAKVAAHMARVLKKGVPNSELQPATQENKPTSLKPKRARKKAQRKRTRRAEQKPTPVTDTGEPSIETQRQEVTNNLPESNDQA